MTKPKHLFDRGEDGLSIETLRDVTRSIFVKLLSIVWGVFAEPLDLDEMTIASRQLNVISDQNLHLMFIYLSQNQ